MLAGRSTGLFGAGRSLEGETDDIVPGSPDDKLLYDDGEGYVLVVALGSPGIFNG